MSKAGILIVEDSFIVAYHLQKTLENEGYHVFGIMDSGEEAIKFIENTRPDLVLMDIMLTGSMDGIETASVIKARFNLPIIYITALTDKNTIQRAKITEPYGYLTKPFEDQEIITVIEIALYKHDIELRLRQSEEKYFATVKSISDAVVIVDSECNIQYINPQAEQLTGVMLNAALKKNVMEVVQLRNESTDEFPVNPIQCCTHSERNSFPANLLLISENNRLVPVGDGSLSSITDKKGNLIGMVMIFKDLSEKRLLAKMGRDFEKHRMTAMIEGQEKERSRIARDLHDGLGQILNALKMNVDMLVEDKHKARDLYKLLDEAIQESIRISENLLPSKLKDFDLATCLRSMCKQMNKSNLSVEFQSIGEPVTLEQARKVNLYRIAQEAVTNAIKHSQASKVNVSLKSEADRIQLCIEDNGIGMTPSPDDRTHNGLVNMRERVDILEGTFSVKSDPGMGTIILVTTPTYQNEQV